MAIPMATATATAMSTPLVANRRCDTRRLAAAGLALAAVWAGVGAVAPAASPAACLVVDSDVGLDDYRALAVLAPARDIRAVVVTEGIAGVPRGATAMSMFLAASGDAPPLLPGSALYLLRPRAFTSVGEHLEPAVPTAPFRTMLVAATNAG